MTHEDNNYEMVVEETEEHDEVMMPTNDFVMQERSRIIQEKLAAEWRKGKSLELGESSRDLVPIEDDNQDIIIIHKEQVGICLVS
jgi:hypothetical protein